MIFIQHTRAGVGFLQPLDSLLKGGNLSVCFIREWPVVTRRAHAIIVCPTIRAECRRHPIMLLCRFRLHIELTYTHKVPE